MYQPGHRYEGERAGSGFNTQDTKEFVGSCSLFTRLPTPSGTTACNMICQSRQGKGRAFTYDFPTRYYIPPESIRTNGCTAVNIAQRSLVAPVPPCRQVDVPLLWYMSLISLGGFRLLSVLWVGRFKLSVLSLVMDGVIRSVAARTLCVGATCNSLCTTDPLTIDYCICSDFRLVAQDAFVAPRSRRRHS